MPVRCRHGVGDAAFQGPLGRRGREAAAPKSGHNREKRKRLGGKATVNTGCRGMAGGICGDRGGRERHAEREW